MIEYNNLKNLALENTLSAIHYVTQPLVYYFFVFLVSVVLIAVLVYRLLYRTGFWGKQPVKRKYDFFDRFRGEGVINSGLPVWNKYCNEKNVTTTDKADEAILARVAQLVTSNESLDNGLVRHISSDALKALFNGFQEPVYISFYSKESLDYGCLTSRPIKIRIKGNTTQAYLFDFFHISGGSGTTKDDVETSLIQTHEFYQRSNNPEIGVSVFLRKNRLKQVSELCAFDVLTYEIDLDLDYDFSHQKGLLVFPVKSHTQLTELVDFVRSKKSSFAIDIVTSMGNLLTLIKKGELFIIGCNLFGRILGYVFFRDFKNGTKKDPILDCIGSLFDKTVDSGLYKSAYSAAFSRGMMIATKSSPCRYLRIWNLSDCSQIIKLIGKNKKYKSKETHYLYLYNYRSNTVGGNEVLILI